MDINNFTYGSGPINYRKLQERLCRESSRLVRLSYVATSEEEAKELLKQSHKLDKVIRGIQDMMRKDEY